MDDIELENVDREEILIGRPFWETPEEKEARIASAVGAARELISAMRAPSDA